MPLTEAQRAYAAAYQTALVEEDVDEEDDAPSADAFGLDESEAEMVANRVRKGTVDFSKLPAMIQPPKLDQ